MCHSNLAGLMGGSVSMLAPVFAAAIATRNSWDAFLVGLAASLEAGIGMGFAEALSDVGSLNRAWPPLGPRIGLRCHDSSRWDRPSAAFPDPEIPRGSDDSFLRRSGRTRYHYLGSTALHGDTDHIGRNASGAGRCHGFRDWGADWQFLKWARRTVFGLDSHLAHRWNC
jgi:hypothetical protein